VNPSFQAPAIEWTSRRVLVTGADGFVGHWLVRALTARGAHVCGLVWSGGGNNERARDRIQGPGVEVAGGDITDLAYISNLITNSVIDTVYHLAAINTNTGSNVSPYEVFETNIRGVYTVLEACRIAPHQVRAVVSSSREVEDCFLPVATRKHHPYMTSKAAAELAARAYSDTFGVPVALVRSDNLYGGGDFNWSRLVPGTMRAILQGKIPVIRSNGLSRHDYVYIEDAVAAYLAIGERLDSPAVNGGLFRVATGSGTSVLEMVKQIARVAGLPDLEPHVLNQKTEERVDTLYVPELERIVLGWNIQYSLEDGLSRTYRWYRDFLREEMGAS
jgi:CDP-glucose 4,6-dehydratase